MAHVLHLMQHSHREPLLLTDNKMAPYIGCLITEGETIPRAYMLSFRQHFLFINIPTILLYTHTHTHIYLQTPPSSPIPAHYNNQIH